MEALRKDSYIAPDINNDFVDGQDNYHVCSFYECKPMPPVNTLVSWSNLPLDITQSLAVVMALSLSSPD